jgi:hypothetical protein
VSFPGKLFSSEEKYLVNKIMSLLYFIIFETLQNFTPKCLEIAFQGSLDFKIFPGGKPRFSCVEIEVYHNVRHLTFSEISGVAGGRGEGGRRPPFQSLIKTRSRRTTIYWRRLMCKISQRRFYIWFQEEWIQLRLVQLLNGMYVILIIRSQKPSWL